MSRHPTALALHGSLLAIEGLNGSPGLGALALKSCVAFIIPLVLRRVATTHAPNNCVSCLLPDKRLCLMSTSRSRVHRRGTGGGGAGGSACWACTQSHSAGGSGAACWGFAGLIGLLVIFCTMHAGLHRRGPLWAACCCPAGLTDVLLHPA